MAEVNVIPVNIHGSHAHFFNWIEFGDHLHVGETLEEQHHKRLKKLRDQYVNGWKEQDKICLRNCFKLSAKRYVDYCLEKKCGGIPFKEAAKRLGYLKE